MTIENGLIYVKPAEGRRVRMPDSTLMSDKGQWVQHGDQHFATLMGYGDLIEADAPKPEPEIEAGPEPEAKLLEPPASEGSN